MLRSRFRRRPSTATFVGLVLVVLICGRWTVLAFFPSEAENAGLLVEGSCQVVQVHDGPLLLVVRQESASSPGTKVPNAVERRVRLIGLEADRDSSAAGKTRAAAATEFARGQVAEKSVRLKFDKRRVDRDHLWLAYVYVDEVLLNERLIEEGLARVSEYPGDSPAIAKRLRAAEARAKREQCGLWSGGNL